MNGSPRYFATRLKKAYTQLPYLRRAFALVWHAARFWTITWMLILVAQGLLPAALVLLIRELVDDLVVVIDSGGGRESLQPVYVLATLAALVMLGQEILRGAGAWVRAAQSIRVQDHVSALVQEKSIELDMAFYDSPDYYDHLYRARNDSRHRLTALMESLGGLVQSGITLVAMAGILIPYGWWLPLVLVVSPLPAFFVVMRYTLREHQWHMRNTAAERKAWYFDYLITAREVAAELRLFDLGEHFMSRFRKIRTRLRDEHLDLLKGEGISAFFAGIVGLVTMGAAMAWMLWRAANGVASLGDLVLFYQAFTQGQGLMRNLLENIGQIYRNMLFLENLFEFLALEPGVKEPARPIPVNFPLTRNISFLDVSFTYPGSRRKVFDGFRIEFPADRITAIVGPNGAGKSTLIKLLCRFYDPQHGRIELDGVPLNEIPKQELWSAISVLFQQPVPYQDTVSGNIAPGKGGSTAGDGSESGMDPVVVSAAVAAGADSIVARLTDGYDTRLGKWFAGGTDLSVGEWQRIGLARAFFRDTPIIILDEPTSSMDPWAEKEWLDRLRTLAQGKVVIIITHRFSTAMSADLIHVMEEGQIVESGGHKELLTSNGRYASSWKAQTGQG